MVLTKDFHLPSYEELTTQELNIGWVYIQAASVFLGKRCEWINNEYMLCKTELKDPRKCLKEGKEVTKCALEGFQDIKKHCQNEFQEHVDCIMRTSATVNDDSMCRATRKKFDDCMLKNLNLERPPFGYFCEARVHDSPRPKPEKKVEEYPDPTPDAIPPPYRPPKYGGTKGFSM